MPTPANPELLAAFGRALRDLRKAHGFSQEALAERSGVHHRYISDVERGVRNISLVNIARFASALGIDISTLMAAVEREMGAKTA